MLCLRCSSKLPLMALAGAAASLPCPSLLLSPGAMGGRTGRELAFAFHLAREAFSGKRNVSQKLPNEALLFLSREMNFSSALRKIGAKDAEDFVLVCEKNLPLSKVKNALALSFAEKIPLPERGKRKGRYFEAELAIEEMALSRVKN